jgi:predicted nucleic acid-binding protein
MYPRDDGTDRRDDPRGSPVVPIVLDANVAVDWFLPNRNGVAEIALDKVVSEGAVVPALWRWEVQDVLRRLNLVGRLTQSVDFICSELRELPIAVDDELTSLFGDEATVAAKYNLTLYDAAYLELALRLHSPLATNDKALASAAKAAKLSPLRRSR